MHPFPCYALKHVSRSAQRHNQWRNHSPLTAAPAPPISHTTPPQATDVTAITDINWLILLF